MSLKEKRALEAYPENRKYNWNHGMEMDLNKDAREHYEKGYEQAIKDACEWIEENCI